MIRVLDSTLREGEQAPGVYFPPESKVRIARLLDAIGVDIIEAGNPSVDPEIAEAVKLIAGAGLKARIGAHARCRKSEVDMALECGVGFLGIFLGVSDLRLLRDYRLTRAQALAEIRDVISHARSAGDSLEIRFTAEDAVRTPFDQLVEAMTSAVEAGADVVSVADTTGFSSPFHEERSMAHVVRRLGDEFAARNLRPQIEVHCHNDRGLALANGLDACRAGATIIDATVLGLGERAGIIDLAELLIHLHESFPQGGHRNLGLLGELYALVSKESRVPVPSNRPMVGSHAFTHSAGIHVKAAGRDPSLYQSLDPELFGRKWEMALGVQSGRTSVELALAAIGRGHLAGDKTRVMEILTEVKSLARRGLPVPLGDGFPALVDRITAGAPGAHPENEDAGSPRRVYPTNPYIEFPKAGVEQSIASRFEQQAALHPGNLAVRTRKHDITYAVLNQAANRIAHSIARIAKPDACAVAILLDHDAPLIAAILGVLKSGNFYIALERSHPPDRLHAIIAHSQASLLITDTEHLALARSIAPEHCSLLNLDQLAQDLPSENPGRHVPPAALAYIVYTSGSTGVPKGVCQSHRSVLQNIRNYTNSCHLGAVDRFSLLTLCCYSASVSNLFGALLNGAALLPLRVGEEGAADLLDWLREEKISVYHSVPLVFRNLAGAMTGQTDLPDMRLVKLGGDAISRVEVDLFKRHFSGSCLLYVGLGASEMNAIRYFLIDRRTEFDGHIAPVGYAAEDAEVLLLDDDLNEVAAGETGEIAVKSPYLFSGYWRRPDLTEAAFMPDPRGCGGKVFRLGDLGRMLPGGVLQHLGRKDFQIKIRGVRIEPGEVEQVLLDFPEVRECVVMARADERGENRLVAYLIGLTDKRPDVSTLRGRLSQKLPAEMIPAAFVWLEEFPLTRNGKLDRKALPAPDAGITGADQPQTLLELKLIDIWQRLFEREGIGRHDHFSDLGGHSLLAARLVVEIDKLLGCKLPIAALFQSPTVHALAQRLTSDNWAPPWSSLVPLQPQGSKPPLFLVHGWGGDVFCFVELARRLAPDQPVYGLQAVGLDGTAERHTTVGEMAGHYVREIRSFQPEGPYQIGGYSLGGLIAFEMAQQLSRQGREVALLAILDTVPRHAPWPVFVRTLLPHAWERARFHLRQWREDTPRDRRNPVQMVRENIQWWAARNRRQPAVIPAPDEKSNPTPHPPGFDDYYQAVTATYRLRRYPGSIDIFWSQSADPRLVPLWGHLARGGSVQHPLPGHHAEVLLPEHLPPLVKALRTALDRAQAGTLHANIPAARRMSTHETEPQHAVRSVD